MMRRSALLRDVFGFPGRWIKRYLLSIRAEYYAVGCE
jgi:hypothetical protein